MIEIWNPEVPTTGEFHLCFYTDISPSGVEKTKFKAWGGKVEGKPLSPDTFDAINIAFLDVLRDAESEVRPSRTSKLASLLHAVTIDENDKSNLVNELQKANSALLEMDPIKKTKAVINANLSDIEQDLLHQQIDIGFVEPKFESIAASLRSWIVPRWFYIKSDFPYYQLLIDKCDEFRISKLYRVAEGGMHFDINGFLSSSTDISDDVTNALLSLMNHSFELYQNGLGYNNLLFMSAVLGDMSLEKEGVYLNLFTIEEPEAHLHPQLQELVHSFFERRQNTSSCIQVIYTSHSPTLVSRIGINSINLLFENEYIMKCYALANSNLDKKEQIYLEQYMAVYSNSRKVQGSNCPVTM